MLEIIDSGNLSHVTSRGAYMPGVTQLSDNSLIACQHVGEALGSPDNHIEVLRSADSAKTWMNQGRQTSRGSEFCSCSSCSTSFPST